MRRATLPSEFSRTDGAPRGSDNSAAVRHVIVGGVRTACLSRQELMDRMVADCLAAKESAQPPKLIFSTNGQVLSTARLDADFNKCLDAGDIIHADGQVIVTASRFLTGAPIPERSPTTDMIHEAAAVAVREGLSFYLLGGEEEINRVCAERMQGLYPGLRVAGRRHGYFQDGDEEQICNDINASGADIIWVGLGQPKETKFAFRNRSRLRSGWLITCGGCFNFVTGHYSRAPLWMQKAGLEWLHRLLGNPRRLAWRYLTTNPHALYLIARKTRRDPVDAQLGDSLYKPSGA